MPRTNGSTEPQEEVYLYIQATDYITGHDFQVKIDPTHGVAYTQPRPADLSPYYPTKYRGYVGPIMAILRTLYRWRVGGWHRAFKSPGRALEIGAGNGFMLRTLADWGWQVIGTEQTPQMASHAHKLGIPMLVGDLDAIAPSAAFDLVIMFQVLEHMRDPLQTLEKCAALVKPDGRLIIAVPNLASWQSRFGGDRWFHLDVPRHLNHFSPDSLGAMLSDVGFRIERLSFESPEHDPYGWVQTILNRLGFPFNRLTRILMRIDKPSILDILQLLIVAIIGLPSVLLSLISWFAGKGAIMQVEAVRK